MHELIPVAFGVIVGLASAAIPNVRLRVLAFVLLSVAAGALASFLAGELETGLAPLFISFDALLVWAGGLVAVLAASWWRSRRTAAPTRR